MIMEFVHFQPQNLLIESILTFWLHAAAFFRVQLNSIQLHNCAVWFNCTLKKAAACSRNVSNYSMSRFWAWKRTNFHYHSQHPRSFQEYLYDIIHCSLVHPSTESDPKECDYFILQSFTMYCQYIWKLYIIL